MDKKRKALWLRTLHQWHWISSALCLIGMLLFSITGITLNHASQIPATPQVSVREGQLPSELQILLTAETAADAALPQAVVDWLRQEWSLNVRGRDSEWSSDEVYVSLPRPGGDAWLSIDRESGDLFYERTDRGWISWLNDLHKGRHTGKAWFWFIDIFAVATLVFTLTGLVLLYLHGKNRPATWPVTGLGLLIPLLLVMFFVH